MTFLPTRVFLCTSISVGISTATRFFRGLPLFFGVLFVTRAGFVGVFCGIANKLVVPSANSPNEAIGLALALAWVLLFAITPSCQEPY